MNEVYKIGNDTIESFVLPNKLQLCFLQQINTFFDYLNIKSSDENYYKVSILNDSGSINFSIEQTPTSNPINNKFNVLTLKNISDGNYYDVSLYTEDTLVTIDVSQDISSNIGYQYIYLKSNDDNFYKIYLYTDEINIIIDIEQSPL